MLYDTTKSTAKETVKKYPGDLELLAVPGANHFAAMSAAKQTWLRWIEDRFENRPVAKRGYFESRLDSFLPLENYQIAPNSFAQWAGKPEWSYEVLTAF